MLTKHLSLLIQVYHVNSIARQLPAQRGAKKELFGCLHLPVCGSTSPGSQALCFVSCSPVSEQAVQAGAGWVGTGPSAARARSPNGARFGRARTHEKASGKKRINKTNPKWLLRAMSGNRWVRQRETFPSLPPQLGGLKSSKSPSSTCSAEAEELILAPKNPQTYG